MPSRNYDTELDQLKAIQNKNRQKTRIQDSTAKYNKKASNYRGGTGHGVVMFSEAATVPAGVTRGASAPVQNENRMRENKEVLDQLDKDIAAEKKRKKTAKKEMNEARRQLVGQRIADGKAHGVILYDRRGAPVYVEGDRLSVTEVRERLKDADKGRSSRARTLDARTKADVIYPRNPTKEMMDDYMATRGRTDMIGVDAPKGSRANVRVGTSAEQVKKRQAQKRAKSLPAKVPDHGIVTQEGYIIPGDNWNVPAMMTSVRGSAPRYEGPYTKRTAGGHTIRKAYFDPRTRTFNVLATKSDVKGTVLGRDYDPKTGRWAEAVYGRSDDYIRDSISGMRLVSPAGAGSASCRKNAGRR